MDIAQGWLGSASHVGRIKKALFLHSCDSDRWLGESELYLVGTWLQSLMLQGDFLPFYRQD